MLTKEDICKITGTDIEELEYGDAIIKLTGITDELPEGLHLCSLTLADCSIKRLPDDLDVQFLEIIRCPNLQTVLYRCPLRNKPKSKMEFSAIPASAMEALQKWCNV